MSGNQAALIGASRPPTLLINRSVDQQQTLPMLGYSANLRSTLSGALSANTLKSIYAVTGSGVLAFAAARALDATSRNIRVYIVVDGTVVYDSTVSSIAAANNGVVAVGLVDANGYTPIPFPFNTSLDIQISSSIAETDKISLDYYAWTTS